VPPHGEEGHPAERAYYVDFTDTVHKHVLIYAADENEAEEKALRGDWSACDEIGADPLTKQSITSVREADK
jgi:hypothetical protein